MMSPDLVNCYTSLMTPQIDGRTIGSVGTPDHIRTVDCKVHLKMVWQRLSRFAMTMSRRLAYPYGLDYIFQHDAGGFI